MTPFMKAVLAATTLGLAAGATGALAQTAPAPATPPAPVAPVPSHVVVYSLQGVVGGSAAGRDMATKLQGIQAAMNAELDTERRAILDERQRLMQTPASQLQSAEVRRADAALQQRAEGFEIARRRTEIDLQATNERALGLFLQALQPVMTSVVERRGAYVVIEAAEVSFAVPGVDITRDLVTALDASVTTINVARVRVQTEEEAAAAAAPGTPAATGTPVPATPGAAPLPRRPTPVPVPR